MIKKTTPRDLLARHNSREPLYKPCRTEQAMDFYVVGRAICPECEEVREVFFNLDEVIYHECNQGNRVTYVPRWTLPPGKKGRAE